MNPLNIGDVVHYVETHIAEFHNSRIERLSKINLKQLLSKKNPYLFKAKYLQDTREVVTKLAEAFLSSSEETLFGDWLEGLAIFINGKVYGGKKSGIPGVDLEFDKDEVRYIVNIKSGPNWGNASQVQKMLEQFRAAKKTLRTSGSKLTVEAVNGCCYGKDKKSDKGEYQKICGQQFWEFISAEENLYIDIIEPLGHQAKERNEEFVNEYQCLLNRLMRDFANNFCLENGQIDWEKIVRLNSGKE
jgi:hypothetical protein